MQETLEGLVPGGDGWFVLNAKDAPWHERPGRCTIGARERSSGPRDWGGR